MTQTLLRGPAGAWAEAGNGRLSRPMEIETRSFQMQASEATFSWQVFNDFFKALPVPGPRQATVA
jgi:hypothetical protein